MAIPKVGQLFQGRYLILEEIGAGGMGLVYRAKQVDADRIVALKLLRSEKLGDDDSLARFYREFKLLNRLNHPHIVQFYSLALDDKNYPFAVCEFLLGQSLRALLIAEQHLAWDRACLIALQICDAMQYIHETGMFHRDLKPDNIILQNEPSADFVKLVDFGLAGEFVRSDETQKITWTGQLIGSVAYMSPEQATSKVDARTDVYSLGCVLFEMLSGEVLFNADTAAGIIYMHGHEDPRLRFACIGNRVPVRLLDLLAQMLCKNAEQRIQTMKEVGEELKAILKDPETLIQGKTFVARTEPGKMSWLPVSISILLLVGGGLFGLQKWQRSNQQLSILQEGRVKTSRHPPSKLSAAQLESLASVLSGLKPAQAEPAAAGVKADELRDDILQKLGSSNIVAEDRSKLEAVLPGVLIVLARQQWVGGQKKLAADSLEQARQAMEEKIISARVRRDYFILHATLSNNPDVIESDLSRGVGLYDSAAESDGDAFQFYIYAANRLMALKRFEKARPYVDLAINHARKLSVVEDLVIGLEFRKSLMKSLTPEASTEKLTSEILALIRSEKSGQVILDQAQLIYEMGSIETVDLLLNDTIHCLQDEGSEKMQVLPACIYLQRIVHERLGQAQAAIADLDTLLSMYSTLGALTGVPAKAVLLKERSALLSKV